MNKRQYKKEYFICKDDFGKNIYAGDTVELCNHTFKNPFTSIVYWDRLHGAMIKEKPIFLNDKESYTHLYHYLNNKPYNVYGEGDEITYIKRVYAKKIKSFIK